MLRYLVLEIAGKQYKVVPNEIVTVDSLGDIKSFECDKILVKADDKEVIFGKPYLKEKVKLEVVESKREPKIRVFKYHAKANTRKITGSRRHVSLVRLQA